MRGAKEKSKRRRRKDFTRNSLAKENFIGPVYVVQRVAQCIFIAFIRPSFSWFVVEDKIRAGRVVSPPRNGCGALGNRQDGAPCPYHRSSPRLPSSSRSHASTIEGRRDGSYNASPPSPPFCHLSRCKLAQSCPDSYSDRSLYNPIGLDQGQIRRLSSAISSRFCGPKLRRAVRSPSQPSRSTTYRVSAR